MRWMADYVEQGARGSIMDAVDNSVWLTTEVRLPAAAAAVATVG